MSDKCKCEFCTTYEFYKWATVMECGCLCHTSDGMVGHDGLCCEFPNGLKKNNPHKDLKPLKYYKEILDRWEKEANEVRYDTKD